MDNSVGHKSAGFTLLEVLIALAILAISATALIAQTGQSVRQMKDLQDKTVAYWLAENQLTELALLDEWPEIGRSETDVTMMGRDWVVDTNVSATEHESMRRIEIKVGVADEVRDNDAYVVTLVGFRGEH